MKCESIKPLPTRIKALKPLTKEKFKRGKYLNEIEMILYSTNLCYYASRILHNEIIVNIADIHADAVHREGHRTKTGGHTGKEHHAYALAALLA